MSAKPDFFRLGVFIFGGIALLVASLLIFGGGQMFRSKVILETYVDGSAQGIDIGSPVKFRGVLIGKVIRISFAFTEYGVDRENGLANYIVLLMEIDREVFPNMFTNDLTPLLEKGVVQGLRVRIEPQGVTGLNYMNIDYLDPKRFPVLKPLWKPYYYYIPSAPGEITSLMDSINAILHELEQFNIEGISKSATLLLDNLNKAVTGAEIEKVSANIQQLVKHVDSALEAAQLPTLSSDARKLLTDVNASNQELRRILQNIEPASRLNSAQIKEVVSNLADTSENLKQLSEQVKKRPSLLFWGKPPQQKPSPTSKRD